MASKKQIESVWLPRFDGAYEGMGKLKLEALAGGNPEELGDKLSKVYTKFLGADSTLGVDAIISQDGGVKERFVNAIQRYNAGMTQQSNVPEAFRNTGKLIAGLESTIQELSGGLMSENLVKRVSRETGIKPVKQAVEEGKAVGYSSAIIQALGNPELREKYGLGK